MTRTDLGGDPFIAVAPRATVGALTRGERQRVVSRFAQMGRASDWRMLHSYTPLGVVATHFAHVSPC